MANTRDANQFNLEDYQLPAVRIQMCRSGDVLFGDTAIVSSEDAAKLIGEKLLRDADREYMIVVCMDNKLHPVAYNVASIGTINATLAHPREIMKSAILANAGSIMLMHNHPSGITTPSAEDIALTHKMSEVCDMMDIPLLDHIIVGGGDHPQPYYSFRIEDNLRGSYDRSSYAREEETGYSASPITVDYYVHECAEFPDMGEKHHGLTLDQAVKVYESIPADRLNGIKCIGVEVHIPPDNPESRWYDGSTIDLYTGKIRTDALDYVDYLRSIPAVQNAFQAVKDRFEPQEVKSVDHVESAAGSEPVVMAKPTSVDDALAKLKDGVQQYLNSDEYKKILDTFSKFHRYSLNNSLLIMMQNPAATLVGSYTTWKSLDRWPVGQSGIKIVCPAPHKSKIEQETVDPTTGETRKELVEVQQMRYRLGTVFDVSSTEGAPLPEIGKELQGDVADPDLFEAVKQSAPAGIAVEIGYVQGEAKGYYSPAEHEIRVREGMSEMQSLKTLIHETTHAYIHDPERMEAEGTSFSQEEREIQAESCAYTIAAHYGLDTSEYSFPYVGSWAGDADKVMENLGVIKKYSSQIINEIDRNLEQIRTEKMDHAMWKTEFGFCELRRYGDEWHYMDYGKDHWGKEANFYKRDGNIMQVARQITMELYGYTGPFQPYDRKVFQQEFDKLHPERAAARDEKQEVQHHSRR